MEIFKSKYLSVYSIDQVFGSLMTHEQKILWRNIDAGDKKKEKMLAF